FLPPRTPSHGRGPAAAVCGREMPQRSFGLSFSFAGAEYRRRPRSRKAIVFVAMRERGPTSEALTHVEGANASVVVRRRVAQPGPRPWNVGTEHPTPGPGRDPRAGNRAFG